MNNPAEIEVTRQDDRWWMAWFTPAAFRRRGYAKAAVTERLRKLPDAGITEVWALIRPHNEPSLRLAEAVGFQRVETTTENVLMVWRASVRPELIDKIERGE